MRVCVERLTVKRNDAAWLVGFYQYDGRFVVKSSHATRDEAMQAYSEYLRAELMDEEGLE